MKGMIQMLKAMKELNFSAMMLVNPVLSVILPAYFIFGARLNIMLYIALISLFTALMSAFSLAAMFPMTGPAPSIPRTMKWAANNRSMMNGAAGFYDMACIFPATRKNFVSLFCTVWIIILSVMVMEFDASLLFNFNEAAGYGLSAFAVCFLIMTVAVPNVIYYKPSRNYFGMVLIVLGFLFGFVLVMADMVDLTIPFVLPRAASALIALAGLLYNIAFFCKTAFKGDFARNGEKTN